MTDDDFHEFFFHSPRCALVAAHCEGCQHSAGVYWADDQTCDEHTRPGVWIGSRCTCDPPPQLPTGVELAGYVDEARRAADHRVNHAPKKIRVR
jgi:hypothetical protein